MSASYEQVAEALRASAKEAERLREQNQQLLGKQNEPIAIVGMSCRYPGGVASPASLRDLTLAGEDGITEFPDNRGWEVERLFDPDPDQAGKSYVREGGFLHGAVDFDPVFFGIGPREALAMDSQQGLLLEGAWEALEDAGIDPTGLRGSTTGVFAGMMYHDYAIGAMSGAHPEVEALFSTGLPGSVASGRIAYTLGLEGPAVTVDTACSSSLVAIHLAAQALRSGECELALAGGVTVMATPGVFVQLSRRRVLAPDGRCKSFAATADGTGWSEGMGLIALERLSDAKAAGRRILAVIRGSATNQDGASNGLTAPNGPSQERVIRQALANAGLKPSEVDAVEAHGTGTTLGDPIEAQALLATYGQERDNGPLSLGSLKSNIGHAQAAAGVGGVIKVVMALEAEKLPRTLHVDEPSPHVDWSTGEVELLTEGREWKRGERPRRAGVSSFGISGTNAHLILEEAPPAPRAGERAEPPAAIAWALSAKASESLAESASRLADHIRAEEPDPADVAHTLLASRASLPRRAVVSGKDATELLQGLDALAAGIAHPGLASARTASRKKIAFVFPGQGSQWAGMAAGLLEESETFAESMRRCEEALAPHLDWPLREALLSGEEEWLSRIELVQPALFATMVSLAELWVAHGVVPGAVIGHSQGEIAAAVLAGAISLEEGAKLAALRSRAMSTLVGKGTMVSVAAPAQRLEQLLGGWRSGEIELAALNSPGAITLACGEEELAGLLEACEAEGIRARQVAGATLATHCAHVEALREEVLEAFADLAPRAARIPIYSTVTGEVLDGTELDAAYWYRNLREPVRFEQVVRDLLADGFTTLIEPSAHPVLAVAVEATAEDAGAEQAAVLHTLRRDEGDTRRFATALGAAHCHGLAVDWKPLLGSPSAPPLRLPSYPFQRNRYWLEAKAGGGDPSSLGLGAASHPFLGASIALASEERLLFTGRVSLDSHPWIADHAVAGTVLLPGVGLMELALRVGRDVGAEHLAEMVLEAPLVFPSERPLQLQVAVVPDDEDPDRYSFSVYARPEGDGGGAEDEDEEPTWTRHATGILERSEEAPTLDFDPIAWPPPGAERVEVDGLYDMLADSGLEYGPAFQGIGAAWRLGEQLYTEVSLAEEQHSEADDFALHPALLDAAAHSAFLDAEPGEPLHIPFGFSGVRFGEARGGSGLRVRVEREGERLSVQAADPAGTAAFAIESLVARQIDPESLRQVTAEAPRDPLYAVGWAELEPPPADESSIRAYSEAAELIEAIEAVAEGDAPELLVFAPSPGGADAAASAAELCAEGLELLQAFLGQASLGGSRLAIVTSGATAILPGEAPDPAGAALWGVVGAAQSENPGRFSLIDTDGEASAAALPAALALVEEPRLALRAGTLRAARLEPAGEDEGAEPLALDPEGTALITGGLTGLGAVMARHLAADRGVRRLLLLSRRGPEAPGAAKLIDELRGFGCEATAVACDVSKREELEAALAHVSPEHPLTAVFHSAGAMRNGLIQDLGREHFEPVLGPKADGAWHLHELTREMDLAAFVVFSSTAANLNNPGQASYAAANSFLNALAQRRQAEGLAATAIAWGLWLEGSEMGLGLTEAEAARLHREGFVTLSTEDVLAFLERALALGAPHYVAAILDRGALRSLARAGVLLPILSGLVPAGRRRASIASGSFARRLAGMPVAEREAAVLGLVREQVAAVLGHSSVEAIEPDAAFKDLGFDSLGAVELRNRLAQASGLRLEATLVFDYPTARQAARHLLGAFEGETAEVRPAVRPATTAGNEPIAIVGASCRFPGSVASPTQLWELIAQGRDEIGAFPDERGWNLEDLFDPDPDRPGKSYAREGGFLHDAADFDPAFFGISPREAMAMDPQQGILLEGAWEALEGAGIDPAALRGSSTGVFAGLMYQDYLAARFQTVEPEYEALLGLGGGGSAASGRLAYTLGLEGPAVTIDTACSSSLVAIHLASQALRSGECELALAGGATVMATPRMFVEFSRQRGLAPDGRCKSFAASADGTGISEGMGLLALERLSDARANGRRILAVIRGSAVNQDGASNGFAAPNGPSQERVIRQALANAGLEPSEVDAVEAHGTGTTLGDPIEAQALLATYGQERDNGPLALGSLKSNIGHAQAAAGVGGVIKMVMALEEEELPPTIHVDEPTPHVDWSAGEVELLTEGKEWKRGERPRRAGISSFGLSGTNAHLVVEEAPELPIAGERIELPAIPLALSAKSPEALAESASRLAAHLRKTESDPLDAAHTLLASRASLSRRAVVVGTDAGELLAGLDSLAAGKPAPNLATGKVAVGKSAWLLSGQGCQRPLMGTELYAAFPAYAEALDRACEALAAEGVEAKEAIFAEPGTELSRSLDRTDVTQASLFATETALAELLRSFGLSPDLLLGHSIGEIAAVHIAGALSLSDAAKLVAARGRLMAALPAGGAMASIRAAEQEVVESLAPFEGTLGIAAVNAPASTVVSGEEEALERWLVEREAEGVKAKRLEVSHAFHSHLIEPMLEELSEVAAGLDFNPPEVPIVSNLTGTELGVEQLADPAYWAAQARSAVRFADGVAGLRDQGAVRFLELGPDAVLTAIAAECLQGEDLALAPALRREHEEPVSFVTALGAMSASGAEVDWKPLLGTPSSPPLLLPSYPFQRSRYWLEAKIAGGDPASLGQGTAGHPFLAASISLAKPGEHLFTGRVSQGSHPWLADHAVSGTVLLPGTAFLEMALKAGEEVGARQLEELLLEAPLVLPEKGAVDLRLSLSATDTESLELEIHSRPAGGEEEEEKLPWARHAVGVLSREEVPPPGFEATAWPPPGAEPIDVQEFYDLIVGTGLEYGPAFQGMGAAWRAGGDVFAEVSLAEDQRAEAERFALHPALLDAAGHVALLADSAESLRLPFGFAGVGTPEATGATELRVRARASGGGIEIAIADAAGRPVCAVRELSLREVDPSALRRSASTEDLYELSWSAVTPAAGPAGEAEVHRIEPAGEGEDPLAAARRQSAAALAAMQEFLAREEAGSSRLAILTEGATAARVAEAPDPAAAAAWGLVRSAQAEHPGRFLLIDGDGTEASEAALATATSLEGEPVLTLREEEVFVPRLARVPNDDSDASPLDPERTVLVTGGLSGLGALAARHVADAYGAKQVVLVGRRGPETPGAGELLAELAELGCEARAVACDVSDRTQLEELLAGIPAEHPLGAVLHCAGAIDDGLLADLDPDRLDTVFAPKADAAWHLHELTKDSDLTHFVLYSSIAGTLESPGQANYAAANAFLDALARRRRVEGLAATAVAWGPWEEATEMTARFGEEDRVRLERIGLGAFDAEAGLARLDAAISGGAPALAAVRFVLPTLRKLADGGVLPTLLSSGIAPASRRRQEGSVSRLAERLAGMPGEEREAAVVEMVCEQVAAVLGHGGAGAVDPDTNFKDLGFDSLGAVELRNLLERASGVRIDATLIFDHPTPAAAARHLLAEIGATEREVSVVRAAGSSEEPIAIVGIGCRYPGEVETPEAFWRMVADARSGVSEFPSDRGWETERIYDPDPERKGRTYARRGGFLHDAGDFDPAFFSISPREAQAMDPQQRLLLGGAWEALHDAGIDPTGLRGSTTGVFAGLMHHDYALGMWGAVTGDLPELEGFISTGNGGSVASGRIAYTLGLEGPAVTVDTACSSSLVAIHLAAQALRSGECELALAGGVTVMATPMPFIESSRQRFLAPDGRCKSFAAGADGTGWSEGMGLLALERLSDAKANGRRILAVIRGSAVNQDGASNGLTAPNGPSQERVIRQALANAGLKPSEVDAVEAHGTGTVLGDPIEAQALLATYGQERENGPLALGSLKSNIGHAQAAAGVGGVIKMVMALEEEELPPTLHVDEPTPHVDWSTGEIELLTEAKEWKRGARPRRAGISSFGISGTNAHLVLEEAPERVREGKEEADPPVAIPLALSAKTPEALAESASGLAKHLRSEQPDPADVAHTLLASRASLPRRAVVTGKDVEDLLEGLDALASDRSAPNVATGRATSRRKVAFVFPGQGSQWAGMAAGLLEESETFAASMRRCEEALAPHLDWPLREALLSGEEEWLSRIELVQPALFATMVSLAELWVAHGVVPGAVIGHSQGEIAAAVLAGAISLEEGARLAAIRAKALIPLMGKGEMASFVLSAEELEPLIAPYEERISIAARNGPRSTVCSGEPEAIAELLEKCEKDGTRARLLPVGYASHCAQIEAVRERLLEETGDLAPRAARIPIYSTVTGEVLDGTELDAAYWYRNLREPVRFEQVVRDLLADGFTTLIEPSAHPVLAVAVEATAEDAGAEQAAVLHTLRRDEGDTRRFATALGAAHCHGLAVDWKPLLGSPSAPPLRLPSYPFQRSRYWLEAKAGGGDPSSLGLGATAHPFLGASIALASEERLLFTGRVSLDSHPWIADHAVAGTVLFPGTAFAELALRAGVEVGAELLQELVLEAPLVLPAEGAVQLQLSVAPAEGAVGSFSLEIHSRAEDADPDEPWTRHGSGLLAPREQPPVADFDATAWPPPGAEPVDVEEFYDLLAAAGLEYGPAFQGMGAAWRAGGEIYAEVSLDEAQRTEAESFAIHPALLDAAGHAAVLAATETGTDTAVSALKLPFAFSGVSIGRGRGVSTLRLRLRSDGERTALTAADTDGARVFAIEAIRVRAVDPAQLRAGKEDPPDLYELEWSPLELAAAEATEAVEICRPPGPAAGDDPARRAREVVGWALDRIKGYLAGERGEEDRLAFVTEGAVAAGAEEPTDPAAAALWGLVRSAQSEHPGCFLLIDDDGSEASEAALPAALAQTEEPQLAIREGKALAGRLVAAEAGAGELRLDPAGTVLITGGLSGIGALTAKHLAAEHGVEHMVLAGRRGPETPGAAELLAELAELGCRAEAVACDVSDREQLEELLDAIPAEHPLDAVIHCAAGLADGLVHDIGPEQLETTLAPKADAAWHLHELTLDADLSAFVLYSSGASAFGNPGQAGYAAANAFLDGLACKRRAEGQPAVAIGWGLWEERSELTERVSAANEARMNRSGLVAVSTEQGLRLFDLACSGSAPHLLAVPLDRAALRSLARAGVLPVLFSGLVPATRLRSAASTRSLTQRLAGVAEADRAEVLSDLVREHVAAVLGHGSAGAIDPAANFKDLGFDSLGAVELRNRLTQATGLRLEATLVFDHPTPEAVTKLLLEQVGGGKRDDGAVVEREFERLEAALAELMQEDHEDERADRLAARLRSFNARCHVLIETGGEAGANGSETGADLESASDEELFELIDREVG